jgi:hypothetical protein
MVNETSRNFGFIKKNKSEQVQNEAFYNTDKTH